MQTRVYWKPYCTRTSTRVYVNAPLGNSDQLEQLIGQIQQGLLDTWTRAYNTETITADITDRGQG